MDAITALAETLQQGLFNISYSISEAEAKIKYADLKVRLNEVTIYRAHTGINDNRILRMFLRQRNFF